MARAPEGKHERQAEPSVGCSRAPHTTPFVLFVFGKVYLYVYLEFVFGRVYLYLEFVFGRVYLYLYLVFVFGRVHFGFWIVYLLFGSVHYVNCQCEISVDLVKSQ